MACCIGWKGVLVCFLYIVHSNSLAQNLVPNAGFEEIWKKPCGIITTPGQGIEEYVKNWYTPTGGTSDLLRSDTLIQCPISLERIETKAHGGQSCAGLIISARSNTQNLVNNVPDYKEYIQVKLVSPLTRGKIYYFEFYAQLRYNSSFAASNLGALFTTEPDTSLNSKDFSTLERTPQINYTEIISDTKGWTKISGCFEAKSEYQYLTIGNFFKDNKTKFQKTIWLTSMEPYYLIDDVLLEEVNIDFLPAADLLGKDRTICEGQRLDFDFSDLKGYDFIWQGGSHEKKYSATESGTYAVKVTNDKCVIIDTLSLEVVKKVNLGPDLKFCSGQEIKLSSLSRDTLLWQDGTITNEYKALVTGNLVAYSLSSQCPSADTVSVEKVNCPNMVPNVFTPNGDGKNDFFVIENIDLLPWELTIHNRWGKQVYKNEHYDNNWNGDGLPTGVYYYLLQNQTLNQSYKGWVTLLW